MIFSENMRWLKYPLVIMAMPFVVGNTDCNNGSSEVISPPEVQACADGERPVFTEQGKILIAGGDNLLDVAALELGQDGKVDIALSAILSGAGAQVAFLEQTSADPLQFTSLKRSFKGPRNDFFQTPVYDVEPVDLNRDGFLDLLLFDTVKNKLSWARGEGNGKFAFQDDLASEILRNSSKGADINGDGRIDILAVDEQRELVWMENEGNTRGVLMPGFSAPKKIDALAGRPVLAFDLLDIDGEGGPSDAVAVTLGDSSDFKLVFVEDLVGSGLIKSTTDLGPHNENYATRVLAAEIDSQEGAEVVVATGSQGVRVLLPSDYRLGSPVFLPADGQGRRFTDTAENIALGDIDGDGKVDILSFAYNSEARSLDARYYLQVQDQGNGVLFDAASEPTRLNHDLIDVADLDGDGRIDMLAAVPDVAWYRNECKDLTGPSAVAKAGPTDRVTAGNAVTLDGSESKDNVEVTAYQWEQVPSNAPRVEIFAANASTTSFTAPQVDRDTKLQFQLTVVDGSANSDSAIASITIGPKPVQGEACSFTDQIIPHNTSVSSVYAADLNNDGGVDVIAASPQPSGLLWYQNDKSSFSTSGQPIDSQRNYTVGHAIAVNNLTGELVSVTNTGTVLLHQKQSDESNPQAFITKVIGDNLDSPVAVLFADLDRDLQPEIVSTSGGSLVYFPNDGFGSFGEAQVVGSSTSKILSIDVADLNGDRLPDLVQGGEDGSLVYYPSNGDGSFGEAQVVGSSASKILSIDVADLNGDGLLDVVQGGPDSLVYYPNSGDGAFGDPQIISDTVSGVTSIYVADLNKDGLSDVVANPGGQVVWYPNNGSGGFDPLNQISFNLSGVRSVYVADLDGDNVPDVVSGSDSGVSWHENLCSSPTDGDSGNGGSDGGTGVNRVPTATPASFETAADTELNDQLAGTDPEGETLSFSKASDPGKGKVEISSSGEFTYTPDANATGEDTFTFTVSDGTSISQEATVTISITAVNDAPTATPASFGTAEDTVLNGQLAGTDPEGDTLSFSKASDPGKGKVEISSSGEFTYTPDANATGEDTFTFTVSDGTSISQEATVTISITAVNDAPTASASATPNRVDQGQIVSLNGSGSTDSDGSISSYLWEYVSGPEPVFFDNDSAANTSFEAPFNAGDYTIQLTVTDNDGATASSTVVVTVKP